MPELAEYARGLQRAHITLGRWLHRHAPRNAVLACQDAGALPYYSGLTTIDELGLNDRYIASIPRPFYYKIDADYLLRRRPDYLVLLSSTPAAVGFGGREEIDQAIYRDARFSRLYQPWRVYQFRDDVYLWVFRPLREQHS